MDKSKLIKGLEMAESLLEKMMSADILLDECLSDAINNRTINRGAVDRVKEMTKSIDEDQLEYLLYLIELLKDPETMAIAGTKGREKLIAQAHEQAKAVYLADSHGEPGNIDSLGYVAFKAFLETSRMSETTLDQASQDNACITFKQRWDPKRL
jgi:hypothetical protein